MQGSEGTLVFTTNQFPWCVSSSSVPATEKLSILGGGEIRYAKKKGWMWKRRKRGLLWEEYVLFSNQARSASPVWECSKVALASIVRHPRHKAAAALDSEGDCAKPQEQKTSAAYMANCALPKKLASGNPSPPGHPSLFQAHPLSMQ